MINMCLSISDLLNFSRRFEELIILFIEFIFDFFNLFIPKAQPEDFPRLYEISDKDKQKMYIF